MKVVLDEGARMPTRGHAQDAGLDLYARETQILPAGGKAVFDTGVHIELPSNTVGQLESKSGLFKNHGIFCAGTIDEGYTGSIVATLYNLSGADYIINEGDKITQLVIYPIVKPELEQVERLEQTERGNGGFGSTGR